MFFGMQDFNFAQLISFAQISPQFYPNLSTLSKSNQFLLKKILLGDAAASLALTAMIWGIED